MPLLFATCISRLEPDQFWRQFLARLVSGLAARGAAAWTRKGQGRWALAAEENLHLSELAGGGEDLARHDRLLAAVAEGGQPRAFAPQSGDGPAGNPTDTLLLAAPVLVAGEVVALIELFQRPGLAPPSERGHLRLLGQLALLAGEYLSAQRLTEWAQEQARQAARDEFTLAVHGGLEARRVCYRLANEGRRWLGCERLSVALASRGRLRLWAISGQDTFDRRSDVVRALDKLVATVVAAGEPLWYRGGPEELAPEIAAALEAYVDLSHARWLAVVPLAEPPPPEQADDGRPRRLPRPVGALVIEQFSLAPPAGLERRVELAGQHAAAALANALTHEELFLLPVWRLLGRSRRLVEPPRLPRTAAAVGAGLLAAAALVLLPCDFALHAPGTLEPVARRDVFAPLDGTVERVLVEHGQQVAAGQVLVELRNTDLEVAIADLAGQRTAAREQLLAVERTLSEAGRTMSVEEQNRLAGQRRQLQEQLASLQRQLELLARKHEQLRVSSPIAGQVTTWDVGRTLLHRPVRQGQVLVGLADTSGDWELELRLSEDRSGHLAEALAALGRGPPVTYRLATDPNRDHHGRVRQVQLAAEVHADEGSTVLVRVDLDGHPAGGPLRPGAGVSAKIHCGRRSLGYVWLYDLVAFVQKRILFKL